MNLCATINPFMLTLWVGTFGGGFNIIKEVQAEKLICKSYSEHDGLANNVVYALYTDAAGNVWLSTNGGVSKFDITNETFTNYDDSDGLQSSEFFWGASYKSN